MARPSQVSGGGGQRPAAAVDTKLCTDLFKFSAAEIVEQILAPSVLRVFETLRHHAGGSQMPQIDVFGIVTANKKIKQTVAIVVKPDRRVGVHPGWQAGLFSNACEMLTTVVVEQLRAAPLVEKEIVIAIVVVIAPDRSHRDT